MNSRIDQAMRATTEGSVASDHQRLTVQYQSRPGPDSLSEIIEDFRQCPRRISPKYFYDSRGAQLFDRITALPEYYLTRVERQIYSTFAEEMAEELGTGRVLIEPGSGSSEKVKLLLDSLRPCSYVPLEITETHLLNASRHLVARYPWLEVHAVCGDYSGGIQLPETLPGDPRLLFFPGSTIGNFEPEQARAFLSDLHGACGDDGALLIGVDLRKDADVLHAAYNDAEQVTAEFNLNALEHLNRLAPANFERDNFRHLAFFNPVHGRIEMHLESLCDQTVTLGPHAFQLAAGECIHTENSYKYRIDDFHTLATSVGFEPRRVWCDPARWFSVHLLDAT